MQSATLLVQISVHNNTEFESFEYWSAERLILNNDSVGSVYPGGTLPISYSIVDRDDHIVDDHMSNISIFLYNEELDVYSNLIVDENGQCPLCDIGIYIQGISIDDVNTTYTISVTVYGDVLLPNDIEIRVDLCPSGFGVFAGFQCAQCIEGTYSINETADECILCDAELLDHMIKVTHLRFTRN